MTEEDKKLISKYMGWNYSEALGIYYYDPERIEQRNLDSNDASLCVKEMQKRGDWEHNFMDYVAGSQRWNYHQCIAWLFNAENFFAAMAQWLKEGKK